MSVFVDAGSMAHLTNQLSSEIDAGRLWIWFGVSVVLTRGVLRNWLARGLAGSQRVVWKAVWPERNKSASVSDSANFAIFHVWHLMQACEISRESRGKHYRL